MITERSGSEIKVTMADGAITFISLEDAVLLEQFPYWAVSGGYVLCMRTFETNYGQLDQKLPLSRLVMMRVTETLLTRKEVDHRDLNKMNNRRDNLRICTPSQNCANRRGRLSKSGYRGVSSITTGKKRWRAYISRNGKQKRCLGYFYTAVEAAKAYDLAAIEHWGEFASLNFPKELA